MRLDGWSIFSLGINVRYFGRYSACELTFDNLVDIQLGNYQYFGSSDLLFRVFNFVSFDYVIIIFWWLSDLIEMVCDWMDG